MPECCHGTDTLAGAFSEPQLDLFPADAMNAAGKVAGIVQRGQHGSRVETNRPTPSSTRDNRFR
jgi:hypothetical protein